MPVRNVHLIPPPPIPEDDPARLQEQRISGVLRRAARVPEDLIEPELAVPVPRERSKYEVPTLPPPAPVRVIPRDEVPTNPGRPNRLSQKAVLRRKKRLEGARSEAVVANLRNDPRREK